MSHSQLIFINSKNRVRGDKNDFYININDGLVKTETKDDILQFSIVDAVISRSWYSIQSNNNTFQVLNITDNITTTYDIPEGYYNVTTLLSVIKGLLPLWVITYDKQTNKYVYQPPNNSKQYKFIFLEVATSYLFGFDTTEQPLASYASPLTSTNPVKVNAETSVIIHSDIPKIKNSCIDNISSTKFFNSDIVCVIPINASPFDNIVYSNQNDNYTFTLSSKSLNMVRFYLTDEFNRSIQVPFDWTMTIKIEYIKEDNYIKETVGRIADYIKYALLSFDK